MTNQVWTWGKGNFGKLGTNRDFVKILHSINPFESAMVAEAYLEAMPNVSVYQVETPEIQSLEEENEELKARLARVELENTNLRKDVAELQQGIANVTRMVEKLVETD